MIDQPEQISIETAYRQLLRPDKRNTTQYSNHQMRMKFKRLREVKDGLQSKDLVKETKGS